ncbi:hypothetical protein, conserved, partial [Eimeria tenella]
AAALRQFTAQSLSGRENEKCLTVEDVLSMISRGGITMKFLQECKYAISDECSDADEETAESPSAEVEPIEVDKPSRVSSFAPAAVKTNRRGKGRPMRTADIASFFKRD